MDKRKKQLESEFEPTNKYAKDYKLFSERLIASISYAIVLSILVIGLMFFTQVDYINLDSCLTDNAIKWINNIADYSFNFLAYYTGFKFLILLLHILIDIYDMLIHDMNMQDYQKEKN